jgi:predicted small lipoprotein YifL
MSTTHHNTPLAGSLCGHPAPLAPAGPGTAAHAPQQRRPGRTATAVPLLLLLLTLTLAGCGQRGALYLPGSTAAPGDARAAGTPAPTTSPAPPASSPAP